ncbi:MAG: extracellular solute-binding protein [Lachnospiraceae bacterium]|nr:extracellular solute-binding protein [Lachnospiraceae bacterium]
MKKVLAMLLAAAMIVLAVGCTSTNPTQGTTAPTQSALAGTYQITIWAPDAAVELTKKQVEAFNTSNTDGIKFEVTVEPVSEADAATNMTTDVAAGGDIYFFAQDQLARLVQAGALAKLGVAAAQAVTEANDAGVVAAAKSGSELYAYPLTADNGYFMYYDKRVISDSIVDSLEDLIKACENSKKYFCMEVQSSAWYLASFFFATGCVSEWEKDSEGNTVGVHDTFNSPEGLIACKGMQKLVQSDYHVSSSKGAEFDAGAAIVVTGTWDYEVVKNILGDNMGVTDLPSFTVDGKSYHMGSFNGCKLLGVKPQTDSVRAAAIHKLAQYLTGEQCQMERFNELSWGPSNKADQASQAVQQNPGLAALLKQNAYSIPQGQFDGSWWDTAKVIGDEVKAAKSEADLQAALTHYQEKIDAVFTQSDAEKNAWSVIGVVNGSNWDKDFDMTKTGTVWKSNEAFTFAAGTEFKVRKGHKWDESYGNGGANFVVETAGTYYVLFDEATTTVTLEKAN